MVKIAIKTQGCSHNYADSEQMAGLLQQAGHELVEESEAELVLFNTCTVKSPTENQFLKDLKQVQQTNKKIIIGGCIPQADPTKFKEFSVIGTRQLDNVVEVVNKTLNNEVIQLLQRNEKPSLLMPTIRRHPLIQTIPISLGCLNSCTFCKTKLARGHLSSYAPELIIDKVRRTTSEGVKEIWLTSQDTGCYGFDIGTNSAKLLKELCKIEKDFRIRFGMGNPNHFVKITDELINAYKHDKVFKFLHIPVQAGNDDVLTAMHREYRAADFVKVINQFRKAIHDITISTDIICGFPTETAEQFEDTIQLLERTRPDIVNVSRYWSRSGTVASRMKQIQGSEIKRRSRIMTDVCDQLSLDGNLKWLGWTGKALVDELGKNNTYIARNHAYKQIIIKTKNELKLGTWVDVKIIDVGIVDLKGEMINPTQPV